MSIRIRITRLHLTPHPGGLLFRIEPWPLLTRRRVLRFTARIESICDCGVMPPSDGLTVLTRRLLRVEAGRGRSMHHSDTCAMWRYWPHLTRTQCRLLGHAPYRNILEAGWEEQWTIPDEGVGRFYVIQESIHYCRVCGKELSHETEPYAYPGRVAYPGRDRSTAWPWKVREHLWAGLGSGTRCAIGRAFGRKL